MPLLQLLSATILLHVHRTYSNIGRQTKRCDQLMVDNAGRILQLCLRQKQLVQLEFVTRYVSLQQSALLIADTHVTENLLCQADIGLHDLNHVVQLAHFEIVTSQDKSHVLPLLVYVKHSQFTTLLCQLHGSRDAATSIYDLSDLSHKIVAPMRRRLSTVVDRPCPDGIRHGR